LYETPAACPLLPLRDGQRFADVSGLCRPSCSSVQREEQEELHDGNIISKEALPTAGCFSYVAQPPPAVIPPKAEGFA